MIKNYLKKFLPSSLLKIIRLYKLRSEKIIILPKVELTYAQDFLYTYHNADFMKEERFIYSYNLGKQTDHGLLIGDDIHWRIHVLCWAATHCQNLPGDFVDCGVGSGIFAKAIINYIDFNKTQKKYYLLDTFYGLDEKYCTKKEMERNKKMGYVFRTGLYEEVERTFKDDNVKIIKGAVPDTLNQINTNQICFISIDMNCVKPEIAALNFFWEKLVPGGIIILDDYGYPGCVEQKNAHDLFAKSKDVMILSLPTCQGLIIKP